MSHLDDGTLQAFLDDELPAPRRAGAAEHMLGCEECRSRHEGLKRANAVFSEAVASLDVRPPAAEPPTDLSAGGRRAAGSFVKAAGLVLLLAAAASAAVPGSPIRAWIESAVEPAPEPVVEPEARPEPTPAPAPAPAPVAVSIAPESGRVEIVLEGLDGVSIRLMETEESSAAVSVQGTERDPSFSMAPGRIEVRGAVGGEVTVEIPRSLREARVFLDGDLYAEKSGGRLRTPGVVESPAAGSR